MIGVHVLAAFTFLKGDEKILSSEDLVQPALDALLAISESEEHSQFLERLILSVSAQLNRQEPVYRAVIYWIATASVQMVMQGSLQLERSKDVLQVIKGYQVYQLVSLGKIELFE